MTATRSASTTSPSRRSHGRWSTSAPTWLRNQGVTLESEPQEYAYTPGYYAVFFPDPDGIKLELVFKPSRQTASA